MTKHCAVCNAEFVARFAMQNYCSKECYNELERREFFRKQTDESIPLEDIVMPVIETVATSMDTTVPDVSVPDSTGNSNDFGGFGGGDSGGGGASGDF